MFVHPERIDLITTNEFHHCICMRDVNIMLKYYILNETIRLFKRLHDFSVVLM